MKKFINDLIINLIINQITPFIDPNHLAVAWEVVKNLLALIRW